MTGPIKQKRAASGYELLKGDDELETRGPKRDGSVEVFKGWSGRCRAFVSNAPASHRMEPAGAERHRRGGRRPSEWERVSQTPYNFNCLLRSASDALNRSS